MSNDNQRFELIRAALTGLCADSRYHDAGDIAARAVCIADKVLERLEVNPTPLPWPERYEVGMRFIRKDGEVVEATGMHASDPVCRIGGLWHAHRSRIPLGSSTGTSFELIEYLSKDTN